MKKVLLSLVVLAGVLGAAAPAHAQNFNRTKIFNSANGVGNSIAVMNGGGFGLPFGGVPFGGGFNPGFGGGFNPGYGGFAPGFGGFGPGVMNFNKIINSGNSAGNSIAIQNGGGFSYQFPGGIYGGFPIGGVNVNVITNSGNGVGNSIGIFNR